MAKSLLDNLSRNKNYKYHPIVNHESWISVDPVVGCKFNCQYCFLQIVNWTGVKPQAVYTVPKIVNMLLNYRYFVPNKSIICFINQSDPFIRENVSLTLDFFRTMERHKLKNPIAVVTKEHIPDFFIDESSSFKYAKPIFFLSYSGLPESIEKGVDAKEIRKNFQRLSNKQLPAIHFWRPLIKLNGTDEILHQVLDYVSRHALASVYIGIKLNPFLSQHYSNNPNLRVPSDLNKSYGDYLPKEIEDRLKTLASKYPNFPIYRHTSCAVSLALSLPDYNSTIYNDTICKQSGCPSWKRNICEAATTTPTDEKVKSLFYKIERNFKFKLTGQALYIYGDVNQDDYNFLLHRLNYPIVAENINYHSLLRGSIYRQNENSLL